MIGVVDYGLGNIHAFLNIYKQLGIEAKAVTNESELAKAKKIILPGVGSFDWAVKLLEQSGMRNLLNELVLEEECPVLGVCLGMQLMSSSSDEGESKGFGWIEAQVKKFDIRQWPSSARLPHMGWNQVTSLSEEGLFSGIHSEKFYFLHSYYIEPQGLRNVLANTDYQGEFVCAVREKNIYGVQFHPEKSHSSGIKLLENFASL